MSVIFYDVRRETYERIDNVVQLDAFMMRIQSRLTNVWFLHLADCTQRTFPQKHYQIHRIET